MGLPYFVLFFYGKNDYFQWDILYTILPKVLGHPLLMKGLPSLVISMSTNLNI